MSITRFVGTFLMFPASILLQRVSLPSDSLALFFLTVLMVFAPQLSLSLNLVTFAVSRWRKVKSKSLPQRKNVKNSGNAVDNLYKNFVDHLDLEPSYPASTGFFGWNYEAAVVLQALRFQAQHLEEDSEISNIKLQNKIDILLERALKFPHAGWWMKFKIPVFWLYSCGDRIGLFGSLFKKINYQVFKEAVTGTYIWPEFADTGLKTRNIGYGRFFGPSFEKAYIWTDDVYMAGAALLEDRQSEDNVNLVRKMLLSVEGVFGTSKGSGLLFHGVKVEDEKVVAANGFAWGRANAWVLLSYALYSFYFPKDKAISALLENQIIETCEYQSANGSFKNVLDRKDSSDEVSYTSAFIFAVGIYLALKDQQDNEDIELQQRARRAYEWLTHREVSGFSMSDTCGKAPMSIHMKTYETACEGLQPGPALGFVIWARNGAKLLNLV